MGVPQSSLRYAGQLFTFNNGLLQLVNTSTQLVLEQQPDNTVQLKPFSGIPQQYWMRAHPFSNDTAATIDLPPGPNALNYTVEFLGCNIYNPNKA